MHFPIPRAMRMLAARGIAALCLGACWPVVHAQGMLAPRLTGDWADEPAPSVRTEPAATQPAASTRAQDIAPSTDAFGGGTLSERLTDAMPTGVQYVLEVETGLQRQSNPFRYSDAEAAKRSSDTVGQATVRAGVIVPLLSERTRLEVSGSRTESRYADAKALGHAANHVEGAFRWQAGDLLVGSLSATSDDSLYRYLNRTAPSRDMVHTDNRSADAGLRITNDLTLPIVALSSESTRHDFDLNRMRFNQDVDRVQVAGRYTGWRQSAVTAGLSKAEGDYFDRTDELAALVGRQYRDTEAFVDWTWDYSLRTTFAGRASLLRRQYPGLSGRDTSLATMYARMDWAYSAKTRFNGIVWRLPYPNSEDPTILFTTSTGAQVSAAWKSSDKLWASATLAAERVSNTRYAGAPTEEDSQVYRAGLRVEWALTRGAVLAVDAWRDRTIAPGALDSFSSNVARVSLLLRTDNGHEQPERLLWHPECLAPRYVQLSSCQR